MKKIKQDIREMIEARRKSIITEYLHTSPNTVPSKKQLEITYEALLTDKIIVDLNNELIRLEEMSIPENIIIQ